MAIYERGYRRYTGPLTADWTRFLVLSRYAWHGLFRSRLLTAFFVLCFFYPIGATVALYLNHSANAVTALHLSGALFEVNGFFFFLFLCIQGGLAFFLATFVGPGLVSPDIVNGALPLYFCRLTSRAAFVTGKMMTLVVLLSLITWVPGVLLFAVQASLEGTGWAVQNLWIARALFCGSLVWILTLCLIALALSAWMKRRITAAGLMLAVFGMGGGFGQAINSILHTSQGTLVDIGNLMAVVFCDLFRVENKIDFPPAEAWLGLLAVCACSLALLARKLKPVEVVK
jgi:ABC-2 type transport system permease protein